LEVKQSKAVHTPPIEDVGVQDTSDVEGDRVIEVTLMLPKRTVSSKTASQREARKEVKLAGEGDDDLGVVEVVSLPGTIVADEVDAVDHEAMVKEMPERPPKKMMAPAPAMEVDQQLSKNPVTVKWLHALAGVVVDEVAEHVVASLVDFIEEADHHVGVEAVTGNPPPEEKNRVRILRTMRPKNLQRTKLNYQLIVFKTRS